MKTRAKSKQELIELIQQALDEVFELRASVEYDEEFMGDALSFTDDLEKQLHYALKTVQSEDYMFGGEDFPFMDLVRRVDIRLLPFKHLLTVINNTHNMGLDADGG